MNIWIALVMACGLLSFYRVLIYHCYRQFPKHPHFYQHKTFLRDSSYRGLMIWCVLYLSLYFVAALVSRVDEWLLLIGSCFVLISSIDFKLQLIPLRLLCVLMLAVVLYRVEMHEAILWSELWLQWGVLGVLFCVVRKGIGLADIYLLVIFSFLFSLFLWLWLIVIASLLGMAYVLMLRLVKIDNGHTIAFAPWLCLSAWLILLLAP